MNEESRNIAIVDFGLGNLYSVHQACSKVGLYAEITSSKQAILDAEVVILPGVGAFGDAMAALHRLDLVTVLREVAASDKLLMGICLGMQLMMQESNEFGTHKGLGIFDGVVVPFEKPREGERVLKVPQIGWNRICKPERDTNWSNILLSGIPDGEHMYFVHSNFVQPEDKTLVLAKTHYGHIEFCSSLQKGTVFACQFHPERSGPWGMRIYKNLANFVNKVMEG
ncbi:MAG: imidazole glycerol phosphate synthase subunit HisH [Chloroflexi bacterium]|nr:imidazole glycerol phosphate synthase subunit HisH [Chloroflexota bacterium]